MLLFRGEKKPPHQFRGAVVLFASVLIMNGMLRAHAADYPARPIRIVVSGAPGGAADLIGRYDIALDIGPTRHGITRGQTIYFFDPSGNRNEVFSGGYTYYPDNPTRGWDADHIGKAIFYYERALNERFLGVVT